MELFVYVQMLVDDKTQKAPIILTMGANDEEHALVRNGWVNFDAAACQCFNPDDKLRIFVIVENHPGGVEAFNKHIRAVATDLFKEGRRACKRK